LRYWDSSALVPLLVAEPATPRMQAIFQADPVVLTWWATELECVSALARLDRQGDLPPVAIQEATRRLDGLAAAWHELQPGEQLRRTARRLLRVHNLRTADALQLAAAVVAAEGRPESLEVVCLDDRLAVATRREGFGVLS